jgi:hypothetical protein
MLCIYANMVLNLGWYSRALEDLAVVYLGSAVFKITRLTFVALFSVHLFACIFFRVKLEGAHDVAEFYASKSVAENVRII